MLQIDFSDNLSISLIESADNNRRTTAKMMYHISGEFAIRWMTAVLTESQ
ncbi:hypothetical protein [Maribacter sp. MMG018]|nr:hypothetical protein [Maribacter sp. MMG018]